VQKHGWQTICAATFLGVKFVRVFDREPEFVIRRNVRVKG